MFAVSSNEHTGNSKMEKAYEQGLVAAETGKPNANPFTGKSPTKAKAWQIGYDTAMYEIKNPR